MQAGDETDTREEFPRISVDNLRDWERIKNGYTGAAHSLLESRLTGRSETEKRMLRGQLQRFIDRTFEKAKKNLRVNGRNFEDLDPDEQSGSSPFDEGLDRLIWSLSDQSLQWDGEISQRRREKPREVLRLMRELVAEQHAVDEAEAREYAAILDDSEDVGRIVPDLPDEKYESVENVARRTFAIAEELKQSTAVRAERTERLKVAAAEVKALKP